MSLRYSEMELVSNEEIRVTERIGEFWYIEWLNKDTSKFDGDGYGEWTTKDGNPPCWDSEKNIWRSCWLR